MGGRGPRWQSWLCCQLVAAGGPYWLPFLTYEREEAQAKGLLNAFHQHREWGPPIPGRGGALGGAALGQLRGAGKGQTVSHWPRPLKGTGDPQ